LLHVLVGEDDFSIRQALDEIKKGIGDASALMTNTTVLDGQRVTPAELRAAAETVPFLADRRLVIVEGLLERFETKGKNNRKKTTSPKNGPEEYREMAAVMKGLPDFTEMVVLGGRIGSANPLLRELADMRAVRTFPLLRGSALEQWVERRVAAAGGSVSPPAVKLLGRLVGPNLWIMAAEVDKLTLYAGGRRIEEADVRAVVSYAQEGSVFAMVDAILESRGGSAQGILQQLLRQGAAPAQLLVMLSRQVRIIYQIRGLRGQGLARGEIQKRLGLTSDFVLNKAWEQADRYSPGRIREVYHRLLEADLAIKTGRMEGELALYILIAELGSGAVSA
jgi:DNA polymerase-3 subunit delta